MFVRQVYNTFAHLPQPVNFQQKVLKSRGHDRSIGCRVCNVLWGRGGLCPDVNLKAQVFYQTQRCCLTEEGKKQPEQLRNQNDPGLAPGLAVPIRCRVGFTSAGPAKASIRRDLPGPKPWRFRLGQSQGTGCERLKTVNSHGCAEFSA